MEEKIDNGKIDRGEDKYIEVEIRMKNLEKIALLPKVR